MCYVSVGVTDFGVRLWDSAVLSWVNHRDINGISGLSLNRHHTSDSIIKFTHGQMLKDMSTIPLFR